ncbi:MAG: O-antigen ligase family protein, partial [Parasphingorhabdus sp.]
LIALPMIDNWYGLPIFLGTSGNPNGFATLFVVGVPLAWMLYLTADNTLIRVLSLFAMTVISFTLIMTFSRSATAAAVIATVLLHHFYNHNSIFSYRFFAKMAITFIFLYWYFKFPYFTLMAVASGETDIATIVSDLFQNRSRHIAANSVPANSIQANKAISGGYRLLVLEYQLSAFLSNPFFGMGYGNFSNYLNNAIGLKVGPHNVFSGIAIEYGALALAFFIGLLALGSHNIIRYINKSPTKNSKMVAASVLAGLGGLLFHGLFHEIYINFTLWFFIATAGVVHKLKVA